MPAINAMDLNLYMKQPPGPFEGGAGLPDRHPEPPVGVKRTAHLGPLCLPEKIAQNRRRKANEKGFHSADKISALVFVYSGTNKAAILCVSI